MAGNTEIISVHVLQILIALHQEGKTRPLRQTILSTSLNVSFGNFPAKVELVLTYGL